MEKIIKNIFSMSNNDMKSYLAERGYPSFRAGQVLKWIWEKGVFNPEKMTNLPENFKEFLRENISYPFVKSLNKSADRTVLFLVELEDGLNVETVLIKKGVKNTVCISTGVGCPLKCKFCATGQMTYKRQLKPYEIVWQVALVKKFLKGTGRINNVVFMGMGEPFLDYEGAIEAAVWLTDKNCLGIGQRRITLSTAGVLPGIYHLAKSGKQFRLAISLNASNDKMRKHLMPVTKKWNLKKIISAVQLYNDLTSRAVTFEYVLIKAVNDLPEHARELAELIRDTMSKVNLIPYNEAVKEYHKPEGKRVEKFKRTLQTRNIEVSVRYSTGGDINAACGQLAGKI